MEIQMLNEFVNQLAMCELLSAHSIITPSIAFDCREIENFIKCDDSWYKVLYFSGLGKKNRGDTTFFGRI